MVPASPLGLLLRALVGQAKLLLLDEPTQELGANDRGRVAAASALR